MLGGYLAQFMWKRQCKAKGADPFDQILADIATFYDPDEWNSYADGGVFKTCSTERKQRLARRKGVNLVSWLMIDLWILYPQHICAH